MSLARQSTSTAMATKINLFSGTSVLHIVSLSVTVDWSVLIIYFDCTVYLFARSSPARWTSADRIVAMKGIGMARVIVWHEFAMTFEKTCSSCTLYIEMWATKNVIVWKMNERNEFNFCPSLYTTVCLADNNQLVLIYERGRWRTAKKRNLNFGRWRLRRKFR